jgi:hypothetical protein
MKPREPGDSRAKGFPPPLPSYYLSMPAGGKQRNALRGMNLVLCAVLSRASSALLLRSAVMPSPPPTKATCVRPELYSSVAPLRLRLPGHERATRVNLWRQHTGQATRIQAQVARLDLCTGAAGGL